MSRTQSCRRWSGRRPARASTIAISLTDSRGGVLSAMACLRRLSCGEIDFASNQLSPPTCRSIGIECNLLRID